MKNPEIKVVHKQVAEQRQSFFKYGDARISRLKLRSEAGAEAQVSIYFGAKHASASATGKDMSEHEHASLRRLEEQINRALYTGEEISIESDVWEIFPGRV